MQPRQPQGLRVSGSVVLASVSGTVTGTVTLSPGESTRGPATWNISGVNIQTSRPGVAPIPRVVVYQDVVSPSNTQGLSYDGSFAPGVATDFTVSRGGKVIAVWTGGLAGDLATITLTGTKS